MVFSSLYLKQLHSLFCERPCAGEGVEDDQGCENVLPGEDHCTLHDIVLDEYGASGIMTTWGKLQKPRKKLVPLHSPQISQEITQDCNTVCVVGKPVPKHLTYWTAAILSYK
jgi:hypothetical protein